MQFNPQFLHSHKLFRLPHGRILTMNKVGTFFLLLGAFLIALFLLSDVAESPSFGLLLFGGLIFIGGILLKIKAPKREIEANTRFQAIKKYRDRPPKPGKPRKVKLGRSRLARKYAQEIESKNKEKQQSN